MIKHFLENKWWYYRRCIEIVVFGSWFLIALNELFK